VLFWLSRHFTFHHGPVLDIEFEKPLTIFEYMNVPRVVIGRKKNNNHPQTFPPTHIHLYPVLSTLVNLIE
jgi:hypothetical protein